MSDQPENQEIPRAEESGTGQFDFASELKGVFTQDGVDSPPAETEQIPASPEGQDSSEVQGEVAAQVEGTEPQSPSLHLAQRFGLDPTRFQSEDEIYDAVRKTLEHQAQVTQYAEQLRQQNAQYQAYLQSIQQQYQPQAPAPIQAEPKAWDPPPYNEEAARRWLTKDEKGDVVWKDGTPPEIRKQAEDFLDYKEAFQKRLFSNPEAALAPFVEPKIAAARKEAEERAYQRYQADLVQREVQQQLSQYATHFVEKDAFGQDLRDPFTGAPKLNEVGQAFQQYDNLLLQNNITDPKLRLNLCLEHVKGGLAQKVLSNWQKGQGQPQGQTPPSSLSQQFSGPQKDLLQRAIRQPNRSGSLSPGPNDPPQNVRLSAGQMLKQQMEADGVTFQHALGIN
jgi:hypothetical protein